MAKKYLSRFLFLNFCFFGAITTHYGQIKKLDSLNALIQLNSSPDSNRVNLLIEYSDLLKSSNADSAIQLAQMALDISSTINYEKGKGWALNRMSGGYWMLGRFPEALKLSLEALEVFESINDVKGIGQSYNSIANTYNMERDLRKALVYYDKSIKIYEQLGDSYNINRANANIGRTYYMLGEYNLALEYIELVINNLSNNKKDILFAIVSNTKGDVLQKLNRLEESLLYYFEALAISEELGITRIITYSTRGISEVYQSQGQIEKSNAFADRTFQLSNDIGYLENTKNAALILSDNFNQTKNFAKALEFYKVHTAAKDSMFNIEKQKDLKRLNENFEIAQKQKEIELLKTKESLQAETNKNQRLLVYLLLAIVVFAIILLTVYIRNYKIKNEINKALSEQSEKLREQNMAIVQSQEEISKQAEMLKEANNLKDKLFSIISHDLKGPFNSLITLIENFELFDLKKEQFDDIKSDIYLHTKSMSNMLNNLLTWSKMKMKGVENERKEFNIKDPVDSAIATFQYVAKEKKISLSNNLASDIFVYNDKNQFEVVLRNLINNAIKFTEMQGAIVVDAMEGDDNDIIVSVKDDGIGMDQETLKKVLDHNVIQSTVGTGNEKGSGLGLLIVKDLIVNNGGKYWIESEKGVGTTFYFTLSKFIN